MAFRFDSGSIAADFVNTAYGVGRDAVELLHSFDDLIEWLQQSGSLDADAVRGLRRAPSARRAATLRDALAFRASLRRLCEKFASGKSAVERDVAFINRYLVDVRMRAKAGPDGLELPQSFCVIVDEPADALRALAWLATDILPNAPHVRRCANEESCTLIFVDTTKNHRRAWCSTKTCGNRAKVAAYRDRQRLAKN